MNKIDWAFWGIIIALTALLIAGIFTSGCALLQQQQRKDTLVVAPSPGVQMWQAAKNSNWIVTISILGIAGGIFATLNGQKWGMAVVVSCCVSLFMSLAVARFAWWMAICGLSGSIGLCAVSILSKKQALIEIIRGGQRFKEEQLKVKTVDLAESFNIYQACNQSKSTQKIVQNIKTDLKVKGEI